MKSLALLLLLAVLILADAYVHQSWAASRAAPDTAPVPGSVVQEQREAPQSHPSVSAAAFVPTDHTGGASSSPAPLSGSGSETPEGATTPMLATLTGYATWYDNGPGRYGAAGPVLREALGGDPAFRGKRVEVCHRGRCTTVQLVDWCACGDRAGEPTLLDLSPAAFRDLASLGQGVIEVTIRLEAGPRVTLPPTSTED